jgi:hypothetical protein
MPYGKFSTLVSRAIALAPYPQEDAPLHLNNLASLTASRKIFQFTIRLLKKIQALFFF